MNEMVFGRLMQAEAQKLAYRFSGVEGLKHKASLLLGGITGKNKRVASGMQQMQERDLQDAIHRIRQRGYQVSSRPAG